MSLESMGAEIPVPSVGKLLCDPGSTWKNLASPRPVNPDFLTERWGSCHDQATLGFQPHPPVLEEPYYDEVFQGGLHSPTVGWNFPSTAALVVDLG